MKAAIFEGEGILTVKDVPMPVIKRPDDVIIKVDAASICGSDIHGLATPPGQYVKPGIIYGHEFCGTVVATGEEAKHFEVNQRVAVNPRVRCGRCYECTHSKGDLCSDSDHYGQLADGGFAEYALVSAGQLYQVDNNIHPDIVTQVEPLACVLSGLKMVNPTPMDYVVLYGAGPIGLTFLRVLKMYGVRNLIVTAKGKNRVEEAKKCGADIVVDIAEETLEEAISTNWPYKADLIIDAVGRGNILPEAQHLVNPRGRILLFGLDNNARSEISPGIFVLNEIFIVGALGKDFPGALELIKNPDLGLDVFITHRINCLEEIYNGIEAMRNKEAARVIVYPNGNPQ